VIATSTPALGIGSTQVSSKDGMVLVYVPAGEFLMGSTDSDSRADSNEKPQHKVYLDAFWIDQTEVTNAMYALCVKAGVCQSPSSVSSYTRSHYYDDPQYANYPVIYVSWDDASTYCQWAGRQLPTEAQWEYACRAGSTAPTFGPLESIAWCGANSGDRTHAVATAAPNAFGLHDTLGNVWEWTADLYIPNAYAQRGASSADPMVTGPGPRAVRGGNWLSLPKTCRASYRIPAAEVRIPRISSEDRTMGETEGAPKYPAYGFRVVLEP